MGAFSTIKDGRSSRWRRRRSRAWATRTASTSICRTSPAPATTKLMETRNQLARRWRRKARSVANTRPNGQEDTPQYSDRHRPGEGERARRHACPTSTPRCRPPGAATTSTTSSTAAASSRSICSRTRRSACSRRTSAAGTCAIRRAPWCRSRPSPRCTGPSARRGSSATTARPPSRSRASPRPGVSSGDGHGRDRQRWRKLPRRLRS